VILGLGFALYTQSTVLLHGTADVMGSLLQSAISMRELSNRFCSVGANGKQDQPANNPISLHDVFFRVEVLELVEHRSIWGSNSNDTIIDHTWIWRADHGSGVRWNSQYLHNGLWLTANNVTVYGPSVEHHHKSSRSLER